MKTNWVLAMPTIRLKTKHAANPKERPAQVGLGRALVQGEGNIETIQIHRVCSWNLGYVKALYQS